MCLVYIEYYACVCVCVCSDRIHSVARWKKKYYGTLACDQTIVISFSHFTYTSLWCDDDVWYWFILSAVVPSRLCPMTFPFDDSSRVHTYVISLCILHIVQCAAHSIMYTILLNPFFISWDCVIYGIYISAICAPCKKVS